MLLTGNLKSGLTNFSSQILEYEKWQFWISIEP